MILREWRGVTPTAKRDEYLAYMEKTGIKAHTGLEGNHGVMVMTRDLPNNRSEIVILTLWDSREAIEAFTGGRADRARYHSKEQDYLVEMPTDVTHYDVRHTDGLPGA